MMLRAFELAAGALMFAVPVVLIAKGDTVKVTIAGGDLAKPIEITDKVWLAKLNVWSGPGTGTNERQSLNVDWSQGKVDPPHNVPVTSSLLRRRGGIPERTLCGMRLTRQRNEDTSTSPGEPIRNIETTPG
jgi:hypothetical protein